MAKVSVLGGAPVTFVDSKGRQLSIPLSLLSFDNGDLVATGWPEYAANQALVDPLLKSLVSRGLFRKSEGPGATPAVVIAARDTGSTGNVIQVSITKVTPFVAPAAPGDTTVDMAVRVEEVYPGLTKDNIANILGTITKPGTTPGMAVVKGTVASDLTAGSGSFPASGELVIGPLTLSARRAPGPGAPALVAELKAADGAMTLLLSWERAVTGKKLTELDGLFEHVIDVSKPAAPADWGVPRTGAFFLRGGSDTAAPKAAEAIVLSA